MAPSNILRAMQPLRTPIIRSATQTLQSSKLSIISGSTSFQRLNSTAAAAAPVDAPKPPSTIIPSLRNYPSTLRTGVVESVGRMDRTVRVSHKHSTWDSHIRRRFGKVTKYLVSDPNNSLREGDTIEFSSGAPKSRHVHHVVERIIAPFGCNIDERPPVPSREEREKTRLAKRVAKWERREARKEAGTGPGVKERVGRIKWLVNQRNQMEMALQAHQKKVDAGLVKEVEKVSLKETNKKR